MRLIDYIKKNHGGNNSDFARKIGVHPQAVWRMIDKGYWYVYDGMLMMCKREIK